MGQARYIDPAPLGWKIVQTAFKNPWNGSTITRDRVFIPSKVSDNHFLGDEYIGNLYLSGSPQLVRAWLEGDWNVIEGAFFPEWTTEQHVIAPFAIPRHWTRRIYPQPLPVRLTTACSRLARGRLERHRGSILSGVDDRTARHRAVRHPEALDSVPQR
jgi:hypothetical protein